MVPAGGRRYRIVVRAESGARLRSAIDGCQVTAGSGTVTITGPLIDQAQLYGLIDRLRDLRVELVSVAIEEAAGRAVSPPAAR